MPSFQNVVIVGAGQAAAWAAKTLRAEGFDGSVAIVGQESHRPYERPPLSKQVLAGTAAAASAQIFKPEVYETLDLRLHLGARAMMLDVADSKVILSNGRVLAYDRLVLATGGTPRRITLPGSDLAGIHYLRTIEDSAAIGAELSSSAHILVVGGGWIGLEVAATARKAGAAVTLIEAAPHLAARCVPPSVSHYLSSLHGDYGVEVITGARLKAFEGAGRVERVRFHDGTTLDVSAVVIGIGLEPSADLAAHANIITGNGIAVDRQWRTSVPHIYAAGDVASFVGAHGARVRLESWDNAQQQGAAVARAILGKPSVPDLHPWFWSDQYDCNLQLVGETLGFDTAVELELPSPRARMEVYLAQGRVVGGIAINAGRELRMLKRLLQSGAPIDRQALAQAKLVIREKTEA